MVARARATRPHASRPARDGAPPRRCLFWETPRARERFAMETAEKQTSRVPPGFSPSIGPARVERASLPDPVARARVRDDAPDSCLTRRSKCESVSLTRRTGRFAPVHSYGPRCTEAFPNRESRLSREARASRVEPAAREADTCRTCEYSRASASRIPRTANGVFALVAPPPPSAQIASESAPPSTRALTFTPCSIRPPRDGPAGRSTRNGARPCATCSCRWRASSR